MSEEKNEKKKDEQKATKSAKPLVWDDNPVCFPVNTLRGWLRTSKHEYIAGGVERPGLFSTSNTIWYGVAVLLIIICESIATYLTNEEGYDNILYIVCLVILDFVVAFIFYWWTSKHINLLKNQNLVTVDSRKKRELKKSLSKWNRRLWIGHILIAIFAGVKIFLAVRIFMGFIGTSFWIICSMYTIGAILHIIATGKFFTALIHDSSMKRAEEKCLDTWTEHVIYQTKSRPIDNKGFELTLQEVGRHKLIKKDETYFFDSYGFLTDDDLSDLISIQLNNDSKRVVSLEGVKFQLEQIDSLP